MKKKTKQKPKAYITYTSKMEEYGFTHKPLWFHKSEDAFLKRVKARLEKNREKIKKEMGWYDE